MLDFMVLNLLTSISEIDRLDSFRSTPDDPPPAHKTQPHENSSQHLVVKLMQS